MTIEMTKKKSIIIIAVVAVVIIAASLIFLMQSGGLDSLEHHLDLAYKYLSEGRYEEALLAFDKVIEIDPKNIEARLGKIEAYVALGETEKAEEIRAEILELDISEEELNEYTLEFERKLDEYKAKNDTREDNESEKASDASESFLPIEYNGEVATKHNIVAHREDGIYVRDPDSSDYEKVYFTKECGSIVTNGKIAYFAANEDGYVKALNLEDGTVEDLYKAKLDTRWGHSLVESLACDGKYLTFAQELDSQNYEEPGYGDWYVLDLETKECTEYEDGEYEISTSVHGVHNGEIYYGVFEGGAFDPVYGQQLLKTDISDPREPIVVTQEGVYYTMIGNSVYYAVFEQKSEEYDYAEYLSKIKIMNLDTGKTRTIDPECEVDHAMIYFYEEGFGFYNYETDEWYYETYDGEVVDINGEIIKWTKDGVVYA